MHANALSKCMSHAVSVIVFIWNVKTRYYYNNIYIVYCVNILCVPIIIMYIVHTH